MIDVEDNLYNNSTVMITFEDNYYLKNDPIINGTNFKSVKEIELSRISSISNQLFDTCKNNSKYSAFVGGIMLKKCHWLKDSRVI